jgi:hypothetical protein
VRVEEAGGEPWRPALRRTRREACREEMSSGAQVSGAGERLAVGACLIAAVLSVKAFHEVALGYGNFRLSYGVGINDIPEVELLFYLWYLLFGTIAVACFTRCLLSSSLPGALRRAYRALTRRRTPVLLLAAAVLLAEILLFQRFVLEYAPIADDESTYGFIAETLLLGRVANPSPGDPPFFRNQFIILNDQVWYGKYPIGHPLLLALGEALGIRRLAVPLVTCASFLLTFAVGRRIFPEREALLGSLLLLLSPHFVFTGATELSQPTSMLCMLAGLWALLRVAEEGALGWALLSGAAFGFGVLVRPLPGVLFAAVAALCFLPATRSLARERRLGLAVAAAIPLVLSAAVLLAVNFAQSGALLRSGYQEFHGERMGALSFDASAAALSAGGALLRQSFWLFGWPVSLLFVPLARRSRHGALLWGMVLAEYAYRVISPKTVVATTGPVYVTEIVPLLALATASGLHRLREWLARLGARQPAHGLIATGMALTTVAAVMFLPVELRGIRRSAVAWLVPRWQVEAARDGGKALVFAATMVDMERENTWAYLPPNPSPDLQDEVVFVRSPRTPAEAEVGMDFWRRRFPDRRAWVLRFSNGQPFLREVRDADDLAAP